MSTPDDRIIRRLREENDELREYIRQLEERGDLDGFEQSAVTLPGEWPISASVRAYLVALSCGRVLSKAQLHGAARQYRKPHRWDDEPSVACVAVQLSRSRRVLAGLGIRISTRWGVGHFLEGESLRIVRDALARGGDHVEHE